MMLIIYTTRKKMFEIQNVHEKSTKIKTFLLKASVHYITHSPNEIIYIKKKIQRMSLMNFLFLETFLSRFRLCNEIGFIVLSVLFL